MKKRFAVGVGAALIALTSVGVVAAQSSAQASDQRPAKHVKNLTTSLFITNVHVSNPGGISALAIGDTLTETNVQKVGGKQVATNVLTCTVGNVDAQYFESVCSLVVNFAKGDLHLQGYIKYPLSTAPLKPYRFAIIGGTRAYENAQGQMVGMDQPNGPGTLRYHIVQKS